MLQSFVRPKEDSATGKTESALLSPEEVAEVNAADAKRALPEDPAEELILSAGIPSLPGQAITLVVQANEAFFGDSPNAQQEALTFIELAQSRLIRWHSWIKGRPAVLLFALLPLLPSCVSLGVNYDAESGKVDMIAHYVPNPQPSGTK